MRKILFVTQPSYHPSRYHVNPVQWMLKLYHQARGQSRDQWQWLLPLPIHPGVRDLDQSTVQEIVDLKPDLVAMSVYVWNKDLFYALGAEIKKRLPDTLIVVGGPDVLGYHEPQTFYSENPWADWCVFSAGEASFTQLLDHISGYQSKLSNVSNRKGFVSELEVFMDKDFMKGSPSLTYANEIKKHIVDIERRFGNQGYYPVYVWETVKGCAYKCSFCDWTSGTTNKVRFWGKDTNAPEPTWKQELKLFFSWELKEVYWTNPNTGQTAEDEEIVDFWCELIKKFPKGPKYYRPIMTKNQKERGFRIYNKLAKNRVANQFYFSLQDLDPQVLKNIDRPDIPWQEHKKYIIDFLDEAPKDDIVIACELIWGLPGQTIEHFYHATTEVLSLGLLPHWNWFQVLTFSPAAKPEYQQQFQMTVDKIFLGGYWGHYCTSSYSMNKKTWLIGTIAGPLIDVMYRRNKEWTILHATEIIDYVRSMSVIDTVYQELIQNHRLVIPSDNNNWMGPGQWINDNAGKIYEKISTKSLIAA